MSEINFLIVLYKKTLAESETVASIVAWPDAVKSRIARAIVWNNSPTLLSDEEKNGFRESLKNTEVIFSEDGINHPLSQVYNSVVGMLPDHGLLVLWDHDSRIPEAFVPTLLQAEAAHPGIDLFLPKIFYNEQLVSPARQYYFYGKYMKSAAPGPFRSRFATAINSGMAIRCSYLAAHHPVYNEEIKFYGTDNDFMYKYSRNNEYFCILDTEIKHTLNFYEQADIESTVRRYRDIKNGMLKQMASINPVVYMLSLLYMFLYTLKLCFRFKTTRFFRS
ncbi:MAG: hypothetical protein K2N04_05790 [Alistipes sp.]|nr:hypothetical protein [Alistipes sp.]